MERFKKILEGYQSFRDKYVHGDTSVMQQLAHYGQRPEAMVVACCDSRVDPAVILQCDPGDLFVVRNVANIIPPFERDEMHHGTSAALEFGVCYLKVDHLVLLGHSQCGGIQALIDESQVGINDFISNWVSLIKTPHCEHCAVDDYAKQALHESYKNCLTFPWIKDRVDRNTLKIHLWFFDIKAGEILMYSHEHQSYVPLSREAI